MKDQNYFATIAGAALCCLLPLSTAIAQQTTTMTPAPISATTLNTNTGAPMTKDELKAQQKQHKIEEKAASANAKAAKSQAKAKRDQDKALRSQERATGVVPKS